MNAPSSNMVRRYPGLYAACLEIALDNGGINCRRSQAAQQRDYEKWLATQPDELLPSIDAWLAALDQKQLLLVCAGGEGEPETEAAKAGSPAFLDEVLNSYFDQVC